jgi:hypothetical protein
MNKKQKPDKHQLRNKARKKLTNSEVLLTRIKTGSLGVLASIGVGITAPIGARAIQIMPPSQLDQLTSQTLSHEASTIKKLQQANFGVAELDPETRTQLKKEIKTGVDEIQIKEIKSRYDELNDLLNARDALMDLENTEARRDKEYQEQQLINKILLAVAGLAAASGFIAGSMSEASSLLTQQVEDTIKGRIDAINEYIVPMSAEQKNKALKIITQSIQLHDLYEPLALKDPEQFLNNLRLNRKSKNNVFSINSLSNDNPSAHELIMLLKQYLILKSPKPPITKGLNLPHKHYEGTVMKKSGAYEAIQAMIASIETVTFEIGGYTVGIDQVLEGLTSQQAIELFALQDDSISVDPRSNKAISTTNSDLLVSLNQDFVLKDYTLSSDFNSAQDQYVSSKLVQEEIKAMGLDHIVEVNPIYAYISDNLGREEIRDKSKDAILMKRVNGFNIKQYVEGKGAIPEGVQLKILVELRSKVQLINDEINSNRDYTDAKQGMILKLAEYVLNEFDYIFSNQDIPIKRDSMVMAPLALQVIFDYYSSLDYKYWKEMSRFSHYGRNGGSSGSLNVMFDIDSNKLSLIDLGPAVGVSDQDFESDFH